MNIYSFKKLKKKISRKHQKEIFWGCHVRGNLTWQENDTYAIVGD